jgi:two-component system sensor histidine kinase AtoS
MSVLREAPRSYIPLNRRFTIAFALVILGLVGLMALLIEFQHRSTIRSESRARTTAIARSIAGSAATSLVAYDYIAVQQIADGAHRQDPLIVYVIIHDKEGRVAGHSAHPEMVGRLLQDSRSIRARASTEPLIQEGKSETPERSISILEVDLPVRPDGPKGVRWGTVRVGLSLESFHREIAFVRRMLIAQALLGILLGVVAGHILSRRITRPIKKLVEASRSLAEGRWDSSLKIETGDEIGILAHAFSEAAGKLTQKERELLAAQDELEKLNAGLEETVSLRTEELMASRELYQLLVENAPDPFVLVQNEKITFANKAFEDLFGPWERETPANARPIAEVFHPSRRGEMSGLLAKGLQSDKAFLNETQGVSASGAPLELEVRGRKVSYQDETALELILVDITNRRRLLRQLVQSERLRAMGEVTTMVAHNFNNVLAIMLARSQFLRMRIKEEALQKSLTAIEQAAQKGAEIVRRIQEFYGEEVDLKFAEISVNTTLRDVVVYVENFWQVSRGESWHSIQVEMDLQPTPFVWGAEPLLQDAFKRILLNSAEAMPEGGQIRIHSGAVNDQVIIRIQDNGTGMPAEVLRRAFDPFFTTKGSRLRGLGLPAAMGIVQRHRGRLELQSEPGQGTLVVITLPAARLHRNLVGQTDAGASDRPNAA